MKIHEYQAKELFRQFGIPVPKGRSAFSPEEALKIASEIGHGPWVVKAQIHAGGRGKGGGVKLAENIDELKKHVKSILGMKLITHQTGPNGRIVRRLLIEEGAKIEKEFYLAITLDRANCNLVVIASSEGGMDIEEVASKTPEKIFKEWIIPGLGLRAFQIRKLASNLGFKNETLKEFEMLLRNLVRFYVEYDCSIAEINPLILTKDSKLVALDAKVNFDDNALFRHPNLLELRDFNEEEPTETQAKEFDLSYISLDGNIGCMVNGAGLAMATMDIIKLEGGSPANFLDVGGSASEEKVREAFKIILNDPKVKAILVNIFGGIMKCDIIAQGIVAAVKELALKVPLVVRLEGTNVDKGKKILDSSGLSIISATDMRDAAKKAVASAMGVL